MKKLIISLICGGVVASSLAAPAAALEVDCSEATSVTDCEAYIEEFYEELESSEFYRSHTKTETNTEPTFVGAWDEENNLAELWMGKNLFLVGNDVATDTSTSNGLMFVAGNTLNLRTSAEYGFVAGNVINFSGATLRDLYIAGNMVTLEPNALIGRDVFAGAASLTVKSDLSGNLAASADRIVLKDVQIAGNVDLTASEIRFEGSVTVAGTLTYNDNAVVSGLNSNTTKVKQVETYHVEEVSESALIATKVYGKFLSIAGLFLAMLLICALCSKLHGKVEQSADASNFGKNLAIGLGVLIGTPVLVVMALCTVVAAPLALIVLALYLVMIYLSQGFAGLWLGHLLIEKVFKAKSNVYLEVLLGVAVLGILALVPYVGVITGLLGLLFGLGFIVTSAKSGQVSDGKDKIAEAEVVTKTPARGQSKKATKATKASSTKATKAKKPAAKKTTAKKSTKA